MCLRKAPKIVQKNIDGERIVKKANILGQRVEHNDWAAIVESKNGKKLITKHGTLEFTHGNLHLIQDFAVWSEEDSVTYETEYKIYSKHSSKPLLPRSKILDIDVAFHREHGEALLVGTKYRKYIINPDGKTLKLSSFLSKHCYSIEIQRVYGVPKIGLVGYIDLKEINNPVYFNDAVINDIYKRKILEEKQDTKKEQESYKR